MDASAVAQAGPGPDAELASAVVGRRYTIDELAAETGVPSRTIRFYQASGALAAPERQGRVAYYGPEHVERLKLVAELQDRGLHLRAIRDLVSRADGASVSVGEWLGLGEKLRAPWSDDRPRLYDEPELLELFGGGSRPGLIADLVRAGLLRREGDARPPRYLASSPGLLHFALRLDQAGVDLEAAVRASEILRKRLSRAADDLVELFTRRADRPFGDGTPPGLVRSVEALRSVGLDAVRLVFAQEMERALRDLVEGGKLLPRKH